MDRRQSSGMEGESQEMKEYGPCVEGQTHPGSPPDPSRKSSCVRKQLHRVRVTWLGWTPQNQDSGPRGTPGRAPGPGHQGGDTVWVGEGKASAMNQAP